MNLPVVESSTDPLACFDSYYEQCLNKISLQKDRMKLIKEIAVEVICKIVPQNSVTKIKEIYSLKMDPPHESCFIFEEINQVQFIIFTDWFFTFYLYHWTKISKLRNKNVYTKCCSTFYGLVNLV